ncbi:MAG: hypothetical protein L3J39_14925 [Verrucomicrobiales bacterium]|nr:hypothetical protein [Verrucomicrobiales bacterium]
MIDLSASTRRYNPHPTRARGGFCSHPQTQLNLLPVEFMTDINNDGKIGDEDNSLASKADESGATIEDKEKGTEFLFYNDNLSNGLWDKDDPDAPASEKDDDDAQEISIDVGISEGEIWLEHPAIAGLSFYESRECKDTEKVNLSSENKFTISDSNPFPEKLFMRADGSITFPSDNPQVEGDLVLNVKMGSQEFELAKIKLTIVKEFGATKYFHAVRDIIYEDNLRRYIDEKSYGNTTFRKVLMCEEHASMWPQETFHRNPQLEGIGEVAAAFPNATVILNGNLCYHSGSSKSRTVRGHAMTDRCNGRIVNNHTLDTTVSTDGSTGLSGPDGRYVAFHSGNLSEGDLESPRFQFGSGYVPTGANIPNAAMGGLAGNYAASDRRSTLTIVGYSPASSGNSNSSNNKGVIFTATTIKGSAKAPDLAADAKKSGVRPLAGAPGGYLELLMLDGASSVGLSHLDANDNMNVKIAKLRHGGTFGGIPYPGTPEYINTYLIFHTYRPRGDE